MGYIDYCLIVDSDSDRRNELKKAISKAGLVEEVMAALNGGHGLLCLNQSLNKIGNKQGVVILNGKTPIMGGFEFLQQLYQGDVKYEMDKLKIVVISDDLSEEEERKYKAIGIKDFLPPCSDETFSTVFKKIFMKPTVRKSKSASTDDNQVYMVPSNNKSQVG
jgi:CheY-like chemotaxis protein